MGWNDISKLGPRDVFLVVVWVLDSNPGFGAFLTLGGSHVTVRLEVTQSIRMKVTSSDFGVSFQLLVR